MTNLLGPFLPIALLLSRGFEKILKLKNSETNKANKWFGRIGRISRFKSKFACLPNALDPNFMPFWRFHQSSKLGDA